MKKNLVLDFIKLENTMVVSCGGTIERDTFNKLEAAVTIIHNQQFEELIIDLSKASYIDDYSINAIQKIYDKISKAGINIKFVCQFSSKSFTKIKRYSPQFSVIFFPTLKNAIDSTIDSYDPHFVLQQSIFFVGQVFEISYIYNDQPISFFTQIHELNDKYLFFAWPRNKDKYLYQLPSNAPIICSFLSIKGIFRFNNKIAKCVVETDKPVFIIKRPNNNQVERIQRRLFSRLKTHSVMNFKILDNNFVPFETIYQGKCMDLSGGGLSFSSQHILEIFSFIYVYLYIPGVSVKNIIGKIIRVQKSNKSNSFGIKFTAIFEKDRSKLMDYINTRMKKN